MYRHREELDRAQKRVAEKDTEVDSLKKLIGIQQQQMDQLMRQFEDLKVIRQKEAQLEKKQKAIEDMQMERESIMNQNNQVDPYLNRSMARSPKHTPNPNQ